MSSLLQVGSTTQLEIVASRYDHQLVSKQDFQSGTCIIFTVLLRSQSYTYVDGKGGRGWRGEGAKGVNMSWRGRHEERTQMKVTA